MMSYMAHLWDQCPDNRVKFGDPRSHRSREIPHEVVGDGIFDAIQLPTGSSYEVICGENVAQAGMDVPVKVGDSSSHGSRAIQQRSRRMRHVRPF